MRRANKDNNDNRPFLVKHPVINVLLAILVLGFLCVGGYYLCILLLKGIKKLVDWIASLTSNIEAIIVVALITGILSLISVIVSKRVEYKKARNAYLAQKREGPYGDFVNMVYRIMDNSKNPGSYSVTDMKEDLLSFSKEITLWGSPKVAGKWAKFRENGANPNTAMNNLYLIESIMNEMRRDLGLRRIHKGGLLSFFVNDIKKLNKRS